MKEYKIVEKEPQNKSSFGAKKTEEDAPFGAKKSKWGR